MEPLSRAGDRITFERNDFTWLGRRLAALNLPGVIVMEGGYATADLGSNVAAFLSGFAVT